MENFFSQKENRWLGSVALLMVVIALGAYASYTFKQAEYLYAGPTVISVSGEGEVLALPDIGEFTFSVRGEGTAAADARSQAAETMDQAIAYLKEQKVAEADINTINFYLNPKYRMEQRPCPMGSWCPPGESVADGYEVIQTVAVKVRDLDNVGQLISGLSELAVENFSGLQFTIYDYAAFKAKARELAIADAKAKSEALATTLGVRIVRMNNYYEDEPYAYEGDGMMRMTAMESMDASVKTEVPVGERKVTSKVTMSFEVK